ncbi:MFS transporter [Bacillus sp. AK128]
MTEKEMAKRNLMIMWFANFFIAGSMTMVLPFLSLYIESFGNFSPEYVQHWSGWTFGITFVTAFIFSPIWGRLGDQYGRKKILIFTSTLLGISIFLMGLVNSVGELFFLRLFMGICTGFISLSQAYISTQTPKEIAGRVMGTLQTGSITGALLGPMIGGVLADSIGFAATFQSVAVFIFISAILVTITKEYKTGTKEETSKHYTSKEVLAHMAKNPVLMTVLFISILIQIAHFSIQPILSLYVSELHGPENIAFFSGIVFSAAGLGNLMMSRRWGTLADNIGYIKVLIILLVIAAVVYLPGAFVTNIWQLTIIRFFLGIAIGGVIPVRIAYIRQEAPISMQGEVLGYNTSLRFLGNIIGPFMGGMISAYFGFSAVFFITSSLLFISAVVLFVAMNRHMKVEQNHTVRQSG